jgi:HAMP domain-containing protein
VTALGKLFRTTTFKLTLVYLTVFALFAVFLLGYFALNTRRLITEQITDTVDAEITGLSEQYRVGGIRRLVIVVDARARRPGSSLYLVTTFAGEALAGNVTALVPGILDNPGWTETAYRRLDEAENADRPEHEALVRVFQLPGGFRLLVGRDLDERERLYHIVLSAGRWSVAIVIVLGLAGGLLVSRRVLRRVDAMTETTRTIMAGDLGERLPVAGTGDELDRLRQYRARPQDAAHAAAQSLRGGAAHRQERGRIPRRAGSHNRGIRRADPHLQRAVDDRAGGIRPGARRHERIRRRRDRARRRRIVRAAGRGERHRA